jgi:hypothetical protein
MQVSKATAIAGVEVIAKSQQDYGRDRTVASAGGENGHSFLAVNVLSRGHVMKAWFKTSCF